MSFEIKTITAFTSIDENGEEGLIAVPTMMGVMPLIAADYERLRGLIETPLKMWKAHNPGKEFKVYRFTNKEDVTEEILAEIEKLQM